MENEKTVIEINGVKLEVDLRNARVIENYKIGDNVRLLVKDYGDTFKTCPAVIVSFDNFAKLPTIVVAYLEIGYASAEIKFAYINNQSSSQFEIAPANYIDETRFKKSVVLDSIQKTIDKHKADIEDLERRREYFLEHFSKYFKDFAAVSEEK